MKKIFIVVFVFVSVIAKGQQKIKFNKAITIRPIDFSVMLDPESDTLIISPSAFFHYIKIGLKIYRIVQHETTIEEVPKIIFRFPDINDYRTHFQNLLYDTTSFK